MKRSTKDDRWVGKAVVDANGVPVGTLEALAGGTKEWPALALIDVEPDPELVRIVAVPADRAQIGREEIRLPYLADEIAASPQVDPDGKDVPDELLGAGRRDLDGSIDDDAGMVLHEERLVTERVTEIAGRARVRKVIVTEEVTVTVPLRREQVIVETLDRFTHEGEGEGDETVERPKVREDYFDGPDEKAIDWVLYGEEPVVTARVVPIERVRVGKETVIEERDLAAEVRSERVELETEGVTGVERIEGDLEPDSRRDADLR